jgi:hypothetical protein
MVSCSLNESKRLLVNPCSSLQFETSMTFYPNDSGYILDSKTGNDYFYFCNQSTDCQIEVFNLEGRLVKTIGINEALKKVGETVSVSVISMDTILVSSFYTNKLVAINSDGEIWFYLDIDKVLTEDVRNMYEFWLLPHTTFTCKGETLYFKAYPRFDKIVYAHKANDLSLEEQNFLYYKEYYNSPCFFKLSDYFSESPNFEFGLSNIYHNICTDNSNFSEYPKYSYINDKLIFFSTFSSSIFIINPDTFIIEKTIDLSSEYTTIGCPAVILTKGKMFEQMGKAGDEIKKSGRIISVLYDNDKYYVVIKHKDLIPSVLNKSSILSFFSVIVLSNDFVMEDEFLFNSKEYNQYSGLITNQGLAFQKLVSDEKKVYSVFNL